MQIVWKRRLTRLFWFFGAPIRRLYRFVSRHPIAAAKCLVECNGEFLLARIDYAHRRWGVVGGALDLGESFRAAAIRELFEEVGITAGLVHHIGTYTTPHENCLVTCHVFVFRAQNKNFKIDGLEIAEADWFKPDQLPSPRQGHVEKILTMYKSFVSTPTQ